MDPASGEKNPLLLLHSGDEEKLCRNGAGEISNKNHFSPPTSFPSAIDQTPDPNHVIFELRRGRIVKLNRVKFNVFLSVVTVVTSVMMVVSLPLFSGVSRARLVCTGIVLIGLFISLEPEIFNIQTNSSDTDDNTSTSSLPSAVWPFIFVLGFLPLGMANTFIEKQLKKDETESLVFLTWVQFFSAIWICLLFWTDFIPGFGAAGSWDQFQTNMKYGAKCCYGQQDDGSCENAAIAYWVFIISYCLANLMVFVLVRFAEGAIYLVIVQSVTTPLGSLFFTFFQAEPKFHWGPVFDITVAFRLVGLCIIVPGVVFYNYFEEQERKRALNADSQLVN